MYFESGSFRQEGRSFSFRMKRKRFTTASLKEKERWKTKVRSPSGSRMNHFYVQDVRYAAEAGARGCETQSVCKESYGTHAFRYRNLHAFNDDGHFNFQSPVFPASGKVKSEISSLFLCVSPTQKKENPSKEGFLFSEMVTI